MPPGAIGDHPLTDILAYNVDVYGAEASNLIRKIRDLSSINELDEWWDKEIGWKASSELALEKSKSRYEELLKRGEDQGWEIR